MSVAITDSRITKTGSLLTARPLDVNLTILMRNVGIYVDNDVVDASLHKTESLDIHIENSTCVIGSWGEVLEIGSESNGEDMPFSLINVTVVDSYLESRRLEIIDIRSSTSHITVDIGGSILEGSPSYAIIIESISLDTSIHDNMFIDNADGIDIESDYFVFLEDLEASADLPHQVTIVNNTFQLKHDQERTILINAYYVLHKHRFHIESNEFIEADDGVNTESFHYCIQFNAGSISDEPSELSIVANNFTNVNAVHLIYVDGDVASLDINDNIFAHCNCSRSCVYLNENEQDDESEIVIGITGNQFMMNTVQEALIDIRRSRYWWYDGVSSVDLYRNEFDNNTGTVLQFNHPYVTMHYNFFDIPTGGGYNVRIIPIYDIDYSDAVVNATYNYWGTSDVNAMARYIFDKSFDDYLMDVIFRPYLESRNLTNVQDEDSSFVGDSRQIGGVVNGDVVLTATGGPYIVTSNIEVQVDDVLTLEEGVVLLFQAGIGITVFGKYAFR